jgi:hypothetical protein
MGGCASRFDHAYQGDSHKPCVPFPSTTHWALLTSIQIMPVPFMTILQERSDVLSGTAGKK